MSPILVEISVVVPVYKEDRTIVEFLKRILPVLKKISEQFEVIFAMDPADFTGFYDQTGTPSDRTEAVILEARAADPRIKLLKFSRRFGQPMATLAGLHYAGGKCTVVIDVDLQDPPELIEEMFHKFKQGYDVVYAQRTSRRGETLLKRLVSYLGYQIINRVTEVKIPANTGDFRLMSRRVVEQVVALKETNGFLRGLVAIVGFRQTSVLFDRVERFDGAGHYNRFLGSLKIGLNGLVCFSNYLLGLSSIMGFGVAGSAFLIAFVYALIKISGYPFPLGNPTIVILVLFLGGVQLISIGILGEYIGRIYDEVKQRPKFIIDQAVGFDGIDPKKITGG